MAQVFGMGMQLMALRAALNGYGWSVLIVLGLVGGVSSLLGVVGPPAPCPAPARCRRTYV